MCNVPQWNVFCQTIFVLYSSEIPMSPLDNDASTVHAECC